VRRSKTDWRREIEVERVVAMLVVPRKNDIVSALVLSTVVVAATGLSSGPAAAQQANARIEAIEQQMRSLQNELRQLKQTLSTQSDELKRARRRGERRSRRGRRSNPRRRRHPQASQRRPTAASRSAASS
jgi:uncharacterized protein YlxW (UPF0749 family)